MKKLLFLFSSILLFTSCEKETINNEPDEIVAIALKGKPDKITICHYNPHNDTYKTILVNEKQLVRHLEHGDKIGECGTTYVPDDFFEGLLIDLGYDDILDDYVKTNNINTVQSLLFIISPEVGSVDVLDLDLTGIEDFVALRDLRIKADFPYYYIYASSLDESIINNLVNLELLRVELTEPLLIRNTNIELLTLSQVFSTFIEISDNNKLTTLGALIGCSAESLVIHNNPLLPSLDMPGSFFNSISIINNDSMVSLSAADGGPTAGAAGINSALFSDNDNLVEILIHNASLAFINVSDNPSIRELDLIVNNLTSLVLNLPNLSGLGLTGNNLQSISLRDLPNLIRLNIGLNNLSSIDVSFNTQLESFSVGENPLTCIKVNETQLNNIPAQWYKDPEDVYSLNCN